MTSSKIHLHAHTVCVHNIYFMMHLKKLRTYPIILVAPESSLQDGTFTDSSFDAFIIDALMRYQSNMLYRMLSCLYLHIPLLPSVSLLPPSPVLFYLYDAG